MLNTANLEQKLSTLRRFKKSEKKFSLLLQLFAEVIIFNKNNILFVFFLYFCIFLYYLLSRLTEIPFSGWCKMKQIPSRMNNSAK